MPEDKSTLRKQAEQMTCPTCNALPGDPCTFKYNSRREGESLEGVMHHSRYSTAREYLKAQDA